jgi:hypothetical protein
MSSDRRSRALWRVGAVALLLLVVLVIVDEEVKQGGGPGIVSFEIAGSEERATEILAEWGEDGEDAARVSLIVDYPYLVAYSIFLALACASVVAAMRARGADRMADLGAVAGWAALAAGACDAVENLVLLLVLSGGAPGSAPTYALLAATAKFTLLGLTMAYVATGLVLTLTRRSRTPSGT